MPKYHTVAIIAIMLFVLACGLATPTPTPVPTLTATVTPTPVVIVVTATPEPTPTVDLREDLVVAPPSDWMDTEIQQRFPGASIWPPVGVLRDVRLYRIFEHQGTHYVGVFEQGEERWEFTDAIEFDLTPTPEPGRTWPEGEALR